MSDESQRLKVVEAIKAGRVEFAPGCADEGFALQVLVLPGRLADEHDPCVLGADSGHADSLRVAR